MFDKLAENVVCKFVCILISIWLDWGLNVFYASGPDGYKTWKTKSDLCLITHLWGKYILYRTLYHFHWNIETKILKYKKIVRGRILTVGQAMFNCCFNLNFINKNLLEAEGLLRLGPGWRLECYLQL